MTGGLGLECLGICFGCTNGAPISVGERTSVISAIPVDSEDVTLWSDEENEDGGVVPVEMNHECVLGSEDDAKVVIDLILCDFGHKGRNESAQEPRNKRLSPR